MLANTESPFSPFSFPVEAGRTAVLCSLYQEASMSSGYGGLLINSGLCLPGMMQVSFLNPIKMLLLDIAPLPVLTRKTIKLSLNSICFADWLFEVADRTCGVLWGRKIFVRSFLENATSGFRSVSVSKDFPWKRRKRLHTKAFFCFNHLSGGCTSPVIPWKIDYISFSITFCRLLFFSNNTISPVKMRILTGRVLVQSLLCWAVACCS